MKKLKAGNEFYEKKVDFIIDINSPIVFYEVITSIICLP